MGPAPDDIVLHALDLERDGHVREPGCHILCMGQPLLPTLHRSPGLLDGEIIRQMGRAASGPDVDSAP
jgi:hypothetical protein